MQKSAQTHCLETKRPEMHSILRCTKKSASVLPGSRYEQAVSLLTAHQINHGVNIHAPAGRRNSNTDLRLSHHELAACMPCSLADRILSLRHSINPAMSIRSHSNHMVISRRSHQSYDDSGRNVKLHSRSMPECPCSNRSILLFLFTISIPRNLPSCRVSDKHLLRS